MNLVLVAGAALPVGWLGGGFIYFLVPPGGGGGGGGLLAKDALGNEVNVAKWIKDVPYPSRKLVEGLKGDAHYLIVKQDNTLAHCDDEGGKVSLRPWTEEDFRTGDKPWWK